MLCRLTRSAGRPFRGAAPRASPFASSARRLPMMLPYSTKSDTPSRATGNGPSGGDVPDGLAEGGAKGRTGGGEALASSRNAPPQPKILNASAPASGEGLTEEQRAEVEQHNADFDKKHDRASQAAGDKVDKKFWGGGGTREQEERGGKTGKDEAEQGKKD